MDAEETQKILESAFKYVATEKDKACIKQMKHCVSSEILEAEYQKAMDRSLISASKYWSRRLIRLRITRADAMHYKEVSRYPTGK